MEFKYSDDNKRYHTLSYYNKHKFGRKILKAVIDAGFTCPNKDGVKGNGGCIFCRDGSGYFTGAPEISVSLQLDSEIKRIRKKFPDSGIIAYFQANTNTYANIEKLKHIYLPICQNTEITGISIGTRADCLSDEVMELLSYIDRHTSLTVELGMQTVHNKTLKLINTNYSHEEFIDGYKKLKKQGIRTCLHIINGLPGESENMMLKTAEELAVLNPDAV